MSIDDLRKIAKLRKIKNYDKMSKEDLIYNLLRSDKNLLEDNYIKYISNNINDDDDGIRTKINNIRIVLDRLVNIIAKKDRDTIRKELYDIEKKKRLTKAQKERIHEYLIKLANSLDKDEEYKHSDHDDLDYFGIRDIENLLDHINNDDYYKPILVKISFNNNCEYYEIRGNRDKKLSIKQIFYMIMSHLTKLIDERKNSNKNEQKVQLSMAVSLMCIADKGKSRTFYVYSDNKEIRLADNTNDAISNLIESFLSNYQKEEQILRNGSKYTYHRYSF